MHIMKKVLAKIKDFFNNLKGFFKKIEEKNKENYTAFLTFMFFVALVSAAIAFLAGVFQAMSTLGALIMVFGSYFSVRVIYHFIKEGVGLIKFYFQNKKDVD